MANRGVHRSPRRFGRIVGELRKLGIEVAKSTVEKYRVRPCKPPSPTWKAFLDNHLKELVSIDFFVVPTLRFRVLFMLVVLAHHRRRVVYFNVTEHPTAKWTAQQMVEAFPWETSPKYLLRDRDNVYGPEFRKRVVWVSRKCSSRPGSLGRTPSRSGSSAPFDANAWIM